MSNDKLMTGGETQCSRWFDDEQDLHSMIEDEMRQQQAEQIEKAKAIALAVWNREIDQISTKEVADEYGIKQSQALRILKKIKEGKVTDQPFVYDSEREGVIVSDGSLFTYSPMDIDGNGGSGDKTLKHYIWFCS